MSAQRDIDDTRYCPMCEDAAKKILELDQRVKVLTGALNGLRMEHHTCGDSWYSCPKSADGCSDESQGAECNCGADRHNATIDNALKE